MLDLEDIHSCATRVLIQKFGKPNIFTDGLVPSGVVNLIVSCSFLYPIIEGFVKTL